MPRSCRRAPRALGLGEQVASPGAPLWNNQAPSSSSASSHSQTSFSFPVKQPWIEPADPDPIQQSARQLWYAFWKMHLDKVYMARPGCGNGQLKWEDVKPLIAPILDDRF